MGVTFESIYEENHQKVLRLCLGYMKGNSVLAEDLTQEVFMKVLTHLKSFRNEAKLSTWIYRITVNTCLMELRKVKYTILQDTPNEELQDDTDSRNDEKMYAKMYACIYKLKKDDRTLILLDLENVPQKEIAEVLGISYEAIRVRMHRIKKSLTKCVQNEIV